MGLTYLLTMFVLLGFVAYLVRNEWFFKAIKSPNPMAKEKLKTLSKINLCLAIVIFLAFLLLYAFGTKLPNFVFFEDLLIFLVAATAAFGSFIVFKAEPRKDWQWKFLAAGFGLWVLGELTWFVYEGIFGVVDPWPTIGDVFWVVGYLPLAIGLIARMNGVQPSKVFNDFVISLTAGATTAFVLVFLFHARIFPEDMPVYEGVLTAAYPIGDIFLLAISLFLLYGTIKMRDTKHYLPRISLAIGLFLYAISDLLFGYIMAADQTMVGSYSNIIYVLAYLLFTTSAYSCLKASS